MRLKVAMLGLVVCVGLAALPAGAVTTMTDLNSTAVIDETTQTGMFTWTVDGVDQMFQQWFWYRVGANGGESSIDTLGLVSAASTGRTAELVYSNGILSVDIAYTLTGGTPGSGTSDIAETIRIINLGRTALDMHFFQYSDFDLNGQIGGQTVLIEHGDEAEQSGAGLLMSETIVTSDPEHFEAGVYANTLVSLDDGSPTTLNDNALAQGDCTWAFQWDFDLAAGGSFLISKDKNISPVPEPLTMVSAFLAISSLGMYIRRRTAVKAA